MDPLVLAVLNVPIYCIVGWVVYGEWAEFTGQLRVWCRRIFSVEFFDGALVPPFRSQLWLYASAAIVYGQYRLLT